MLTFGIDILILAVVGVALVLATYVAAALIPLTREGGVAAVTATAITATSMIVAYIVMAHVLDNVLGYMGW